MENQTVIEFKGLLPDTSNDTIPHQCCSRKKVPLVVLVILVVIGAIVGGIVNAWRNTSNQEDAEDIRNETQFPYRIDSSINKCLYITSEDFLTKLISETFAYEEVCTIGSEFVKKICSIGKEKSESSHVCEKCTDGSILPSFCFCDKTVHCVKDKELGSRAADDSKKNCNWCAEIFNIQFPNRGNASCSSYSQDLLKSTCNKGYDGFMCSVITTRVCTLKLVQPNLKECNTSNLEECFLKSTRPGKYYHCQPFTDSNIKERSFLEACNLNATP
ncbi:uncharacterized protein LOC127730803 [Mytilus californianus]|uniref:uncharacterized protein LOC127730803 n=1 Tax=Mytilus californianus TaxID=6549 RepID=UPI002247247F|nr:uncharacterized protein LOC127730803 [Mytilus californianus]